VIFQQKSFFAIFALFIVMAASAPAMVVFQFNYLDSAGQGFNDAVLGPTRQAALQAVADSIGQNLQYNVNVQMDVQASLNTGTGFLASAGSLYFTGPNGFQAGFLAQHIMTGTDPFGGAPDGQVQVNFGYNWNYTSNPSVTQVDFKSVIEHELTHALGFESLIQANGTGLNGTSPSDVYSTFDSFLKNGAGTRIVNAGGTFNNATLTDLTSDVFFTGANAMAANGGNAVRLDTPGAFALGTSISHVDASFTNDLMLPGISPGTVRQWTLLDVGILKDLGFSVVPEPSANALVLCSLLLLLLSRPVILKK
jgi:hypothetical protein